MSDVSTVSAFFLGVFLECIMYGIFVTLFIAACYVQWEKFYHRRGVNNVMASTTIFFGFTVTTGCILALYRAMGVIRHTPPGVPASKSLAPPYPAEEIARSAIFQFQIVVSDVIMVYRMYHIYDRNPFICIVPSITILALFSVGCGLTNQLRHMATPQGPKIMSRWSAACYSLTMFLFTTVAIGSKLWRVYRETARVNIQTRNPIVLRAMVLLIESAALWTAAVTMNFLGFLFKSPYAYTFLLFSTPMVGISFCLIAVRLGHTLPAVRDETWHMSTRTPGSRTARSDQVAVSFSGVKVQRDVFVSDSKDDPTETSGSHKQEYVSSSSDSPTTIRASLNLPVPK